jgi:predicted acyltransferase
VLVIGYWAILKFVPGPGSHAFDLSPEGNLGAAIDRWVFGNHLWRQSRTWDPEGLLSTLPAIATTLSGLAMGYMLAAGMERRRILQSAGVLAAGAIVTGVIWAYTFPINKSLWTSSYVLITSGLAALLLIALEAVVRTPAQAWARPFVALGRNALLLFVLSGFLAKTLSLTRVDNDLYRSVYAAFLAPKNASLLWALTHLALLFALLWWLDRRRWYWRV